MEVRAEIVRLELAETFVISRETADWADVVHVTVGHDGQAGRGEAAPIERYSESAESALAFISEHGELVGDDPFALEEIGARLAAPKASRRRSRRSTRPFTTSRESCSARPSTASSGCRARARPPRGRCGSATPTTWLGGRRPRRRASDGSS